MAEHAVRIPDHGETVDSLKRKFSSLNRKQMPTGDRLNTDDMRRAKQLRSIMTERADLGVDGDADEEIASVTPHITDEDNERHALETKRRQ